MNAAARGLSGALLDFRAIERLAEGDSPVHRLDARAKTLVALAYALLVVSTGRGEVAALAPCAFYPAAMTGAAGIPFRPLLRMALLSLPFALAVGCAELLLDRSVALRLGPFAVTGGALALAALAGKSLLAVYAALALVATTPFPALCRALSSLRVPEVFVAQLMFLHRYLLVLGEEGARMELARSLRSGRRGEGGLSAYGSLAGTLLLRTVARAERIHAAMRARGFRGNLPAGPSRPLSAADLRHLLVWVPLFAALASCDVAAALGRLVAAGAP